MIQAREGDRSRVNDRGAGLIEYALLLALIALVCISALMFFGGRSNNNIGHSKDCIDYYTNNNGTQPSCG